jgi:uncharacterized protein (DUF2267 family)
MTVPQHLALAQQRFDALLVDLMDRLDLTTRHQVYAVLFAFLTVFRRRLDPDQVLVFAGALPALLSAMFVADWEPGAGRLAFSGPEAYDDEIRSVRVNHNLAPEAVRAAVASIVRAHCNEADFERALSRLPREAADYWA